MKRKSLIVYSSLTRNTEQIALAFKDIFEANGFEATLAKVLTKSVKPEQVKTFYAEDYDFVCLGAPIIAALPYHDFNVAVGMQNDPKPRNVAFAKREASLPNAPKKRFGIAFTTYGGCGNGPRECVATLEILNAFLRLHGCSPVGMYACAGKELRHQSVDNLAGKLQINICDAQAMMTRYNENPDADEFKAMTPQQIEQLRSYASVSDADSFGDDQIFAGNDPLGIGKPGQVFWHYDLQSRPHARDIQKAKYFLENIIESLYLALDGEPRDAKAIYKSYC